MTSKKGGMKEKLQQQHLRKIIEADKVKVTIQPSKKHQTFLGELFAWEKRSAKTRWILGSQLPDNPQQY